MSKEGEKKYYDNKGLAEIYHSANKPFSDHSCGPMLAEIGAIISLLPPPPLKILDLGCGMGWTSIFLAKRGYEVIGVDISDCAIENANKIKKQEKTKNLDFLAGDYEKLNFNNDFDVVLFFDSLHHSLDENAAIRSAFNALKKEGMLICSEPGLGHDKTKISKMEVKNLDVTERAMPPVFLKKIGRKAGFLNFNVYPRANFINMCLYKDSVPVPGYISFPKLFQKIFKYKLVRTLATFFLITFYKKLDGIVVMKK